MEAEDPWAARPAEADWAAQPDAYHAAPAADAQAAADAEATPECWVTPGGHLEYAGQGTVYTLHLVPPIVPYPGADPKFCAGHYTGHADAGRLDARLAEEASGGPKAAKILQTQVARGGSWRVSTEPGGYATERKRKQESAYRRCPDPECAATRQAEGTRLGRRARQADAEPEAGG